MATKTKTMAAPTPKQKPFPMRMPEDWKARIRAEIKRKAVRDALGLTGGRGMVTWIRAIIRPVLDGELVPVFEGDRIVGFKSVEMPSRKPVSEPPGEGRPPATEER